ncbi:MFS transporter [Nonomuraea jabiensis]|uniref:MFS family permease n=1 Tax=Nonomuraea jabiensis TaxID=882448 RepID=A0A7W9GGK9_9ACTN|nr:MFS transporter [Nonomuraea jabiensis]MBB5783429.1 MFS family permease [Nonomuraea jabiensis]
MIGVVLLGGLLGILNSTMAAVAATTPASALDASLSTVGWASTGFLLAVTATIPFTTWAVDKYGGRRLWLAGLAVFIAGSLAAGLAWNAGSLIAFRTLQGFGAGLLDPLVLILLARAAGPARAGRVMGLMGVALSLGPVLGPIAGGAVLGGLSWRWMFLLSVPVGLIAYLLAVRVLPADSPAGRHPAVRLDVLGLALLAPGFSAMVLALSQTAEHGGFTAWQVLLPLAAGIVLISGYVLHALGSRRTPPLIDVRLFTSRGFTASVTIMGLGGAIAMPLAGRLSDRIGARGLAAGGALVAGLSALAFTQIDADTSQAWPVLAALTIGLGMGCFSAPTMGSLYRSLPGPLVAQGSSVLNQLGAALGIALVPLMLQTSADAITGLHSVFWLVTVLIAAVLVATSLLPSRTHSELTTTARAF